MTVGKRIKKRMADLGMKAPKLSEASGVPLSSIRNITGDQCKNHYAVTLSALSEPLECDIDYLLGKQDQPRKQLGDDTLFLSVLEAIEKISIEKGINLEREQDFKRKCVMRIIAYMSEKSLKNIDPLYAEWVFLDERNKN